MLAAEAGQLDKACPANEEEGAGGDLGDGDGAEGRPLLRFQQGLEHLASRTEEGLSGSGGGGGGGGCGSGGCRLPAALLLVVLGLVLTLAYYPECVAVVVGHVRMCVCVCVMGLVRRTGESVSEWESVERRTRSARTQPFPTE